MYELLVLAALFLGVIVLSKTREGLEPTQKIKPLAANGNIDTEELEKRWNIVSQTVKNELIKFVNTAELPIYSSLPTAEERAKYLCSVLIEQFYEKVYVPAKTPITEANIDTYVEDYKNTINTFEVRKLNPTEVTKAYKGIIESGALKELLKAYFIAPPPAPVPPPPPEYTAPELPQSLPPELNNVLDIYRTNYLEYRTTGQTGYKTAYQAAENYINSYMKNLQDRLEKDGQYVKEFLDKYGSTNTDLATLQGKMKTIREEGPKTEDAYLTIKRGEEEIPVDYTEYYIKGAVLVAIVGVVVAVSFF